MLDLADVQPCDYIIDLGSGDGRIVIAAAKRGATGHGIDLDPQRIAEARDNARKAGVADQLMFMEQNIFDTDFSRASVITMYLLPSVNKRLRPELLDKLEPGTRVVSHSFNMGEWDPDQEVVVEDDGGSEHQIFYWVIPAKLEGTWQWSYNGTTFDMNIHQNFQHISVTLSDDNGNGYEIKKAVVQGKRVSIQAANGSQRYILSGKVEGSNIVGIMQNHDTNENSFASWEAVLK
jgi:SAM-dependent methyltransferase